MKFMKTEDMYVYSSSYYIYFDLANFGFIQSKFPFSISQTFGTTAFNLLIDHLRFFKEEFSHFGYKLYIKYYISKFYFSFYFTWQLNYLQHNLILNLTPKALYSLH